MIRRVDVAIIGAGPAGLAAAISSQKAGITNVVVLERENQAGGTPRHCGHPPFGIREFGRVMTGPNYAARLRSETADLEVLNRHTVTAFHPDGVIDVITPEGPRVFHAKRVIVATGIREKPRSARLISGARPMGICTTGTLQQFVYLQGLVPFKRPLIVGSELVAFSALLTCRKAGIKPVAMIEEASKISTWFPSALYPRLMMGLPVMLNTKIDSIEGNERVAAVRVTTNGTHAKRLACDGVLLTGQFIPENALIKASHLVLDQRTEGPEIDPSGQCSDPIYYATGNVLGAVKTAGHCFREGHRVGKAIAASLKQGNRADS